jgi:hypothetical protein
VLGTYVLLEASLQLVGQQAAVLKAAIEADSAARPTTLAFNWNDASDVKNTMNFAGIAYEEYLSPASGVKEVRWLGTPKTYENLPVHLNTKPGVELRRPTAYWIPAERRALIKRLERHGVKTELHLGPVTRSVEMYRLVDPQPAAKPFEGRHLVTTKVKAETRTETFAAGSVRVPTDQPLGDLVVALLEPESDDSLLAWGFFPEILQRTEYIEGYVVAPMAEKMLAADPKLKAEFEAKLAADPKFAADATARLQWFYQRSKFYDDRYLLYPVGIER